VGLGAGGSGTALLVLMAQRAGPARRPAAATIAWVLMFAGFVVTATISGRFLDPFTASRLVEVTSCVAGAALLLTTLAVWGVEGAARAVAPASPEARGFRAALMEVWSEPASRRFAIFVFLSMLAYSALELILDPFAGQVFGFTPGASTKLSGMQHGGALAGMILVAVVTNAAAGSRLASLRLWTMGGCAASALALVALAATGIYGPGAPLIPVVFALGLCNGVFAISAIGSMMQLVGQGASSREGVRMGLWGAAQAVAFAAGGVAATTLSDISRAVLANPAHAYAAVFGAEALLFVLAARQAAAVYQSQPRRTPAAIPVVNTSAIVSASGG
jgi:BCD family chlorophyll transporter-like MFS transporter